MWTYCFPLDNAEDIDYTAFPVLNLMNLKGVILNIGKIADMGRRNLAILEKPVHYEVMSSYCLT